MCESQGATADGDYVHSQHVLSASMTEHEDTHTLYLTVNSSCCYSPRKAKL